MSPPRATDVTATVLALFWLLMGTWHFTAYDETLHQMPSYWPWKSFFVYGSGVAEIVAALALVPRRFRSWGALGTMILLVAYTPAVVHIVANDATPTAWPTWARAAFRWGVVPANVGLFVWARAYRDARSGR